jgi:hypothetical protein
MTRKQAEVEVGISRMNRKQERAIREVDTISSVPWTRFSDSTIKYK